MAGTPALRAMEWASKLRSVLLIGLVLAAVWSIAGTPARAENPDFPQLTGRVVDDANLLSAAEKSQITEDLAALEASSTDQLVVVTLPSLQGFEIEEFGYKLGRHWGIGQKDKDNGALLIIAPKERKVRIEVGRRLEPLLTDALTKLIIENGILPRFRDRDFPGGIKAGVSDIIAVLTGDAEELKMRAKAPEARPTEFKENIIGLIFVILWCVIVFTIIRHVIMAIRGGIIPSSSSSSKDGSSGSGSGSSWGSGGSSGGGWSSGGGGFSGGGGSFGGGGSSGGW